MHLAGGGAASIEDKEGDLSSKGPVIHSNPDKILQRKGRKAVCTMAMLCVREHMVRAAWPCL